MTKLNDKNMIARYPHIKISEQTKMREALQQMALLGLERHGFFEKALFYGGTALRILYGLDRFSEDLDFSLLQPDRAFAFAPFLEGMRKELAAFGFEMEVSEKKKTIDTGVVSAFMKGNTIQLYLAIGDEKQAKRAIHNEKIQIKLEVEVDPPPGFRVVNGLVLNPTSFYIATQHKSDLFAGKMHALLFRAWKTRVKGRDWYDLIWFIRNKVPLGIAYLEARMRQAGQWDEGARLTSQSVRELLLKKIEMINWEEARSDVRAFIADPSVLGIWSSSFFAALLEHLLFEE